MTDIERYFYKMFLIYDSLHRQGVISNSLYNDLCRHGESLIVNSKS